MCVAQRETLVYKGPREHALGTTLLPLSCCLGYFSTLQQNTMTKATYNRKHLMGVYDSRRLESMTTVAGNMVVGRQTRCWSSSWQLHSETTAMRQKDASLGMWSPFDVLSTPVTHLLWQGHNSQTFLNSPPLPNNVHCTFALFYP